MQGPKEAMFKFGDLRIVMSAEGLRVGEDWLPVTEDQEMDAEEMPVLSASASSLAKTVEIIGKSEDQLVSEELGVAFDVAVDGNMIIIGPEDSPAMQIKMIPATQSQPQIIVPKGWPEKHMAQFSA